MRKSSARNYYVRNINTHLLNVLEESYYIEIGSVDIHTLDRCLKGQVIDLKELIYLQTLNEGIGKITNDVKDDYNYQLNYLLSFRQKSSTHKFFLTAGLFLVSTTVSNLSQLIRSLLYSVSEPLIEASPS